MTWAMTLVMTLGMIQPMTQFADCNITLRGVQNEVDGEF